MTDQQKKALEESAKKMNIRPLSRLAFIVGAQEVISNPEKYRLVPFEDYKKVVQERVYANEEAREERKENARLRYALKDIADRALCYPEVLDIARQALKGGDTCKP